MYSLSVSSLAN